MKHFFLILTILLVSFFWFVQPVSAFPLPEGLDNALRQIQDTAAAIRDFSLTLYGITSFFAKLMGFSAILLLIATLVTSSGLVSVGVPSGKISFFTALAFWDVIWILWAVSSSGVTREFAGNFLLTNGRVLAPFVLFEAVRLGVPRLWTCILRRFRRGVSRREAGAIAGDIARMSALFQASVAADIADAPKKVVWTAESIESARKLRSVCDQFLSGAKAPELKPEDKRADRPEPDR